MTIFVKVLIGVAALALGVYLGMPGKEGRTGARGRRWKVQDTALRRSSGKSGEHDEKELEQLERDLGLKRGLRRRAKRHFTPLDLLKSKRKASHARRTRQYFRTASPSSEQKDDRPGD